MKNRINKILEEHFQIDFENSHVIFETMFRKNDPEQFDTVKELYKKRINENENRSLYLSDDIIIHIQQIIPKDEIADTSGDYSFYYPICSKEEFIRIKNIQNTDDYLLKIRAESIAYDPRFSRVFFSRYQKKKKINQSWSITDYYKTNKFKRYINRLSPNLRNKCLNVSSGFALISEPNGICMRTKYGKIIILSESLQYFLHFMNIHFFCDVPDDDSMYAVIIAMRIFIEKESLDFDLDPRGVLPDSAKIRIKEALKWQLEFVIGHEYAHLLCGHLSEDHTRKFKDVLLTVNADKHIDCKIYTQSQQQELEADLASINNANYDEYEKATAVYQACLFFYFLHLGEIVSSYLFPRLDRPQSHPSPVDRVKNLRDNINIQSSIISHSAFENIENIVNAIEQYLMEELLPYHTEMFEMYGSIYLPSYKKEFLQDRIDF